MRCPKCQVDDTKVIDSRDSDDGSAIRRRRSCVACSFRFTTYERCDEVPLVVVKSDGRREPFERPKVIAGLESACKGRPVPADEIERIAEETEEFARLGGPEVPSAAIGVAVLDRLRVVDEVAYLRFASVYKDFDAAADFQRELVLLKKMHGT